MSSWNEKKMIQRRRVAWGRKYFRRDPSLCSATFHSAHQIFIITMS